MTFTPPGKDPGSLAPLHIEDPACCLPIVDRHGDPERRFWVCCGCGEPVTIRGDRLRQAERSQEWYERYSDGDLYAERYLNDWQEAIDENRARDFAAGQQDMFGGQG